jgi:hypothetical protein
MMARKLRRLGYAFKRASWFAGFFFFSMLSFCAAVGLLTSPAHVVEGGITGSGKSDAGAWAGIVSPDFFGLRRH